MNKPQRTTSHDHKKKKLILEVPLRPQHFQSHNHLLHFADALPARVDGPPAQRVDTVTAARHRRQGTEAPMTVLHDVVAKKEREKESKRNVIRGPPRQLPAGQEVPRSRPQAEEFQPGVRSFGRQ